MRRIHRSREGTKFVSASSPTPTLMNVLPFCRPTSQPSLNYGITYFSRKWTLWIFLIEPFNALIGRGVSRRGTRRLDDSSPAPWLSSPSTTTVRSRWLTTGDESGVCALLGGRGAHFYLGMSTKDPQRRRLTSW